MPRVLQTLVLPAREQREPDRAVVARVLVMVACIHAPSSASHLPQKARKANHSRNPFIFLYRLKHSPTAHAYGRNRLSASFSTSRTSLSLSPPRRPRRFASRISGTARARPEVGSAVRPRSLRRGLVPSRTAGYAFIFVACADADCNTHPGSLSLSSQRIMFRFARVPVVL